MSFDTQAQNKERVDLDQFDEIWLFGYGSLLYKVDFPILDKRPCYIRDWERRFWQGSHDHRGTPDNPGRVLTLIQATDSVCQGMAYKVSHDVFDYLDHREKNGYLRHVVDIHFSADESVSGVIYIADEDNAAYLGPATEQAIAEHIAASSGPSGPNREYVYRLADALRELDFTDRHVFAIESELHKVVDLV